MASMLGMPSSSNVELMEPVGGGGREVGEWRERNQGGGGGVGREISRCLLMAPCPLPT